MPAAAQQNDQRTSTASSGASLRIVPSLTAPSSPNGGMLLTRKFTDGIEAYANRWPGTVQVYLRKEPHGALHHDTVEIKPGSKGERFQWIDAKDDALIHELIDGASVLLITLVDTNLSIIERAIDADVPVVLISELSARTREQIVDAETKNPVLRWRRKLWSRNIEREYLRVVSGVTGMQCNGTPTFDSYSTYNSNTLLYLDSRVTRSMLVTDDEAAERAARLSNGAPLRLAFTGRLNAIKGADDVPRVAAELRSMNIPFTLDIFGGGATEFESLMHRFIENERLSDCVTMKGAVDFENELVPYVRQHVDVFVCCHRQGDPSCTYLETMSCGVPIAGYDNEAWQGLLNHGAPGWMAPMNDPKALAARIAHVHENRNEAVDAAARARVFASEHTFDQTMNKRVAHLMHCAGITATERRG